MHYTAKKRLKNTSPIIKKRECSTSGTYRVTIVTNSVISHE